MNQEGKIKQGNAYDLPLCRRLHYTHAEVRFLYAPCHSALHPCKQEGLRFEGPIPARLKQQGHCGVRHQAKSWLGDKARRTDLESCVWLPGLKVPIPVRDVAWVPKAREREKAGGSICVAEGMPHCLKQGPNAEAKFRIYFYFLRY